MASIATITPSELQLDLGREEVPVSPSSMAIKRESSALSTSDEPETPSPGRTRKPMRKRAKTQEEKEERAQERIMRNRAAAQVSRERKREHMVALEEENDALKEKVAALSQDNGHLRDNISSLTQRLEQMERMMALFTAPGTTSISDQAAGTTSWDEEQAKQNYYCPTPPGTIRPQDILSNPSTPLLESLDSRNPAVIVNDPQRRISMRYPWNLSSRSPIYRQMVSILSFWTTILHATTLRASMTHKSINPLTHSAPSQRQFSRRALDHWRFTATGRDALPKITQRKASLLLKECEDLWFNDYTGRGDIGLNGKRKRRI